jgi:hypothetical protein
VKVNRTGFGGNGTYRAAKVQVSCDENGLYTRLELGEKDSMI